MQALTAYWVHPSSTAPEVFALLSYYRTIMVSCLLSLMTNNWTGLLLYKSLGPSSPPPVLDWFVALSEFSKSSLRFFFYDAGF